MKTRRKYAVAAVALIVPVADVSAAQAPVWSVGDGPAIQIGAVDADSMYLLHRVAGVTRMRDGRIVIGDASGVRYYDADGQYMGTAARQGRGPGEYRTGQLFRAVADSIVIWDSVGRKRLIIAPDGQYLHDEPLTIELPEYPAVSFEFSEIVGRSVLLSRPQPRHEEGPAGSIERPRTPFKLIDLESGHITEMGTFPQKVARVLANGPARHAYQPYSPETVYGVGPDRIYIGDSGDLELQVFTLHWPASRTRASHWVSNRFQSRGPRWTLPDPVRYQVDRPNSGPWRSGFGLRHRSLRHFRISIG